MFYGLLIVLSLTAFLAAPTEMSEDGSGPKRQMSATLNQDASASFHISSDSLSNMAAPRSETHRACAPSVAGPESLYHALLCLWVSLLTFQLFYNLVESTTLLALISHIIYLRYAFNRVC